MSQNSKHYFGEVLGLILGRQKCLLNCTPVVLRTEVGDGHCDGGRDGDGAHDRERPGEGGGDEGWEHGGRLKKDMVIHNHKEVGLQSRENFFIRGCENDAGKLRQK